MIKNGKVFGKFNVIDFLAVLVIVVALAALAVFFLVPRTGGDTLVMKFRIEEVDEFVAEKVKVGDKLYDDTNLFELGEVIAVDRYEALSHGEENDGVYSFAVKEGINSMIITGKVKGEKTDLGAEINGKKYGVGHTFVLRAGDAKLYLRVFDIDIYEEGKEYPNDETGLVKIDETKGEEVSALITLYVPEARQYAVDVIGENDEVSDANGLRRMGTVTGEIITDMPEAYVLSEGEDGGLIRAPKENCVSAEIKVLVSGILKTHGIEIDGRLYSIGKELSVNIGYARFDAELKAIEK